VKALVQSLLRPFGLRATRPSRHNGAKRDLELPPCSRDLIDAVYKIRWLNLGAADQSDVMSFHILDRDDSSTFLPREQLSPSRIAGEKMVQVKTLNDIVSTYGLPTPDLVKIDAEGLT